MAILAVLCLLSLLCGTIFAELQNSPKRPILPPAEFTVPVSSKVSRRTSKINDRAALRGRHSPSEILHLDGAAFDNEYLVNITVGGKPFQVILDTGSSDIWVTNSNFTCVNLNGTIVPPETCKFGPAMFNPADSATFQLFPNVTFLVRYGSGEFLAGPTGFDTIAVGELAVALQEFGVPNENFFLGDGVSEGVLGLAFPALTSVWNVTSRHNASGSNHIPYTPFFLNAVQKNRLSHPYFSVALDRPTFEQEKNDPFDPNLGFLAFGGIAPVPVLETEVTVPIQGYATNSANISVPSNVSDAQFFWYTIDIDSYTFPGSEIVVTKNNNTFLDSGTTLNLVPTPVAQAYNALFSPPATLNDDLMYVVDCNATAPPFAVVVGGKSFAIDPRDQIVAAKDADGNLICLSGTQDEGPDVPGNSFILGDVFFHNVVTTFNPVDGSNAVLSARPAQGGICDCSHSFASILQDMAPEMTLKRSALLDLPDDVAIYLLDLLPVPQILILRQTCKRMKKISDLRIVWTNACNHQILLQRYPFPADVAIEALTVPDLERHVRHAYLLASRWLSDKPLHCSMHCEFDATNGTPVSELRFVPGHAEWIIAVSKSIWSIIAVWELSNSRAQKRFEWSRRDCLLQNFILNGDTMSDAMLAVSVIQEGHTYMEILSIRRDLGFVSLGTIDSALNPVYFHGDILILCDPIDVSVVLNWKTGHSAILRRPQDESLTAISLNDRCIQVMFPAAGILVVRARTLTLFPNPPLTPGPPVVYAPLAVHSFGWVDGAAVTTILGPTPTLDDSNSLPPQPLSILIRPEPDDPWAADSDHALDLHVLRSEPTFPLSTTRPYIFPPVHTARAPSTRGSLQCSDLRLGPHGTAVWIEPQDRSAIGLLQDAHVPVAQRQNERLVYTAFPGPLFRGSAGDGTYVELDSDLDFGAEPIGVRVCTLCTNELNNWKALDYDEVRGRVAVGSTRGRITVLSLAEL
ncbi:Acid protease [Mycena venus]|uniref:Acid protease n=1 Tax=Mycena venus TaxID=2733690 RepID=A0A8H7D486_9AGAR|nr:Acid protease [Mycena venus]